MFILISNNKNNEYEFSQLCRNVGINYSIYERQADLFSNTSEIKNSIVIVDLESIMFQDLIFDLMASGTLKHNVVLMGDNVSDKFNDYFKVTGINDAFVVAKFQSSQHNNTFSKVNQKIDDVVIGTLNKYGFSAKYDGYKYLKSICKFMYSNPYTRLNCSEILRDACGQFEKRSNEAILRNLRYVIERNTNDEINNLQQGNGVSIKAVIAFIVENIKI